MNKSFCFLGCVIVWVLTACTKDRIFTAIASSVPAQTDTLLIVTGPGNQTIQLAPGDLTINEFVAKGSTYPDQLTSPSDWVELYNSRSDTLALYQGYWFTTDTLGNPGKFQLPVTFKIPPHGYFVFVCDDSARVSTVGNVQQLHTSFGLSSSGESIGLFYSEDGNHFKLVDGYSFGAQTAGPSTGRYPDGSNFWYNLGLVATPGSSNHQ